jgi:hypothetical protein
MPKRMQRTAPRNVRPSHAPPIADHARRKLIEITRTGPAPIAEEGVTLIRGLYTIEAEIKGADAVCRLVARQKRSALILARLDDCPTSLIEGCFVARPDDLRYLTTQFSGSVIWI